MTGRVQTDRASNAWGAAATHTKKMQFNTCFCSSATIFSPTGFLIQCMTSRQRVLKVFRQRSSSFRSGQWQMSRRGRSKTACPGKTTELWSACRGELLLQWGEGTSSCNIIFFSTIWLCPFKPTTSHSMHYVQNNSRVSLRYRQFILSDSPPRNILKTSTGIKFDTILCARRRHLYGKWVCMCLVLPVDRDTFKFN